MKTGDMITSAIHSRQMTTCFIEKIPTINLITKFSDPWTKNIKIVIMVYSNKT